jgi:hypothetical protein
MLEEKWRLGEVNDLVEPSMEVVGWHDGDVKLGQRDLETVTWELSRGLRAHSISSCAVIVRIALKVPKRPAHLAMFLQAHLAVPPSLTLKLEQLIRL